MTQTKAILPVLPFWRLLRQVSWQYVGKQTITGQRVSLQCHHTQRYGSGSSGMGELGEVWESLLRCPPWGWKAEWDLVRENVPGRGNSIHKGPVGFSEPTFQEQNSFWKPYQSPRTSVGHSEFRGCYYFWANNWNSKEQRGRWEQRCGEMCGTPSAEEPRSKSWDQLARKGEDTKGKGKEKREWWKLRLENIQEANGVDRVKCCYDKDAKNLGFSNKEENSDLLKNYFQGVLGWSVASLGRGMTGGEQWTQWPIYFKHFNWKALMVGELLPEKACKCLSGSKKMAT